MESWIVRTKDLKKYYKLGENTVKALDGVDFTVMEREFAAIIGKSGSGKSTLLHMIGGLDEPTGGAVYVDGKNLALMSKEQLAVFRRRKVGIRYNKEYDETTEAVLKALMQDSPYAKDFSYDSKIDEAASIKKAQGSLMEVGLGIVLILALIGVMNYVNTTAGNIQSRQVELSIMESIGMTQKQVKKMLILEGILLAGGAVLLTLTLGLGVTYFVYQSMNYMGAPFEIPVILLMSAIIVIILICIVIPLVIYRNLESRGTLVERIRGFE